MNENDDVNENNDDNYRVNNKNTTTRTTTSKSFEYKTINNRKGSSYKHIRHRSCFSMKIFE